MKKLGITLLAVLILSGCGKVEYKRTGFYLDSIFEITVKQKKDKKLKAKFEKAISRSTNKLVELDASLNKLSPISEINAVNSNAAMRNVEVSPLLYELFKKAYAASAFTDGYFDVTWYPLIKVYDGGHYDSAKKAVGYSNILVDKSLRRIRYGAYGLEADFDRMKQSYAIDLTVDELKDAGVKSGVVRSRTVTYYLGKRKEKVKIYLGIEPSLTFKNCGVAIVRKDEEYLRNVDKWKKYLPVPVSATNNVVAVAVAAPNAATAEVLANAFYFMGTEKAIQKMNNIKKELNNEKANVHTYEAWFVVPNDRGGLKLLSTTRLRGH